MRGGVVLTTHTATWVFLAVLSGSAAFPQVIPDQSSEVPFSIGINGPLGSASFPARHSTGYSGRSEVTFEGLLARSDGETLSVELADERVIRFQLSALTRYVPDGTSGRLSAFRIADIVSVQADVKDETNILAHSVKFVRRPSEAEQAEVLQSPEIDYRWEHNVIGNATVDPAQDNRKLSLVAKPVAISEGFLDSDAVASGGDALIASVRAQVNDAFERLPDFRAREVTSMFHSTSKRMKWVPNGLISAEVAYESGQESYSDVQVNGKRPVDAPLNADADYMRSFHNAWSTGDFESLAHCVFSGLDDSEFHLTTTERHADGDLAVYEFAGGRASTCVAVRSGAQVAYPSYKGLLKVNLKSKDVVHVELAATDLPKAFPLDHAERSVDFGFDEIGATQYLLPKTAYWFGCYRNSYSCFLNRVDFRNYRRFSSDSTVRFPGQ